MVGDPSGVAYVEGRQLGVDAETIETDELYNDEEPNLDISEAWHSVFSESDRYETQFDSIDGIEQITSGSGSISLLYFEARISTGSTDASHAAIGKTTLSDYLTDYDKDRRFHAQVKFDDAQGKYYIGMGRVSEDDFSDEHVGFKVTGTNLEASVANGTTETTTQITSNPTTGSYIPVYIEYLAGDRAKFWVDKNPLTNSPDVEVTSNLPSGKAAQDDIWMAHVENDSATNRQMRVQRLEMVQMP